MSVPHGDDHQTSALHSQATQPAEDAPTLHHALVSSQLLGGKPSVTIDHDGVHYILRATRGGKLILTK